MTINILSSLAVYLFFNMNINKYIKYIIICIGNIKYASYQNKLSKMLIYITDYQVVMILVLSLLRFSIKK